MRFKSHLEFQCVLGGTWWEVSESWGQVLGLSHAVLRIVNKCHEIWWFYKGEFPCTNSLCLLPSMWDVTCSSLPSAMIVRPPQPCGTLKSIKPFYCINYPGMSLLAAWKQANTGSKKEREWVNRGSIDEQVTAIGNCDSFSLDISERLYSTCLGAPRAEDSGVSVY